MSVFYVIIQGDAFLSLDTIEAFAVDHHAVLRAVDSLDVMVRDKRTIQLPTKKQGEQREYLFTIEASDQEQARLAGNTILRRVVQERDAPVYQDIHTLIDDTTLDHTKLEARYVHEDYGDVEDLLITRPGSGDTPTKIYYRGSIGYACLELLARFSKITTIDD